MRLAICRMPHNHAKDGPLATIALCYRRADGPAPRRCESCTTFLRTYQRQPRDGIVDLAQMRRAFRQEDFQGRALVLIPNVWPVPCRRVFHHQMDVQRGFAGWRNRDICRSE